MILPISSNNVSFGGIVKVKAIFKDGQITHDDKIINSALTKFTNVLKKRTDTAENTVKLDSIRNIYAMLDKDYIAPTEKIKGNTKCFLATIKTGNKRFIVTGKEAEDLAEAGKNIGRTGKILEMDFGTRNGAVSQGRNEAARLDYRALKDEISLRYTLGKEKPSIILYTITSKKGKKSGIELSKIGFEPKIILKQTHKPQLTTKISNEEAAKKDKYIQSDFLNKLFS